MIVFIIAGGSGTRLWPLSTHSFPKHLLKLTDDKSLLQNTISRVEGLTSLDKIFVISEASHVHHVREQAANLTRGNILSEPGRRGTANCVLWALSEVKKRGTDKEEPVLFLWADHLIRDTDAFVSTMHRAGELAASESKLAFIGIEPTWPATSFGYMEKGKPLEKWVNVFELKSYKEKPDRKTAEIYFRKGKYVWNTGYLMGSLATFEREIDAIGGNLKKDYEALIATDDLEKTYLALVNQALDYALSEKVEDGLLVPCSFDWVDVGSFHDLHEISLQDEEGNHMRGPGIALESTTNSYVRNETDTPIAVIGLDNIIVVNTPNGILVTNKNYAQKVGDVAKKLQEKS